MLESVKVKTDLGGSLCVHYRLMLFSRTRSAIAGPIGPMHYIVRATKFPKSKFVLTKAKSLHVSMLNLVERHCDIAEPNPTVNVLLMQFKCLGS